LVETARRPWPNALSLLPRILRIWRLSGDKTGSKADLAGGLSLPERPGAEFQRRLERVLQDLERFTAQVRARRPEFLVAILSGTGPLEAARGNRPVRFARALQARSEAVVFQYHSWHESVPVPAYGGELLIETPLHFAPAVLPALAAGDFGAAHRLLLVTYPHPAFVRSLNRFNAAGWTTVYDCRDDWEAFYEVGQAPWYGAETEAYIVHNVDLVTCVSRGLQDKMRAIDPGQRIELLPNGYDPQPWRGVLEQRGKILAGYDRAEAKVGYIGHLTEAWFDWAGLIEVARLRPQVAFELIGHSAPSDLRLPENVRLLGPKRPEEIAGIARHWQAAMICFKQGPLAEGVDPIKIYEYLALGLPTVSFRMPQIEDYPYTWTVETAEAFAEALDQALTSEPDQASITDWLADKTWDARLERLLSLAQDQALAADCVKSFS
jgi:glycosyltransferase involved in cell wall biosynthesis